MAETTARELKLIQYLNEAYGKEKQLETALPVQIKLVQKTAVKKRLQDHLKETKAQSKGIERRIKALGGKAQAGADLPGPDITDAAAGAVANVANRALAAAKGPVQALRGSSAADNQLRNMRDAYWNEAEEIAHYRVIEAAADQLGDAETVKMAKEFRRQEERMQSFLEKQIPQLVREVIREEVPAKDRKPAGSSTRSRSASSRSTSRSSSSRAKPASSRAKPASSRAKPASSSRSAPKTATRARTTGSSNGRSASTTRRKSSTSRAKKS